MRDARVDARRTKGPPPETTVTRSRDRLLPGPAWVRDTVAARRNRTASTSGRLAAGAPCTPSRWGDTSTASCGSWCNDRKCDWCKCRSCLQCSSRASPLVSTTRAQCHMSYVIFSMQRSGTTTLCRDLNRLNMNCMYELFNWGENNAGLRWSRKLNISAEQAAHSPMEYVGRVLGAENASRPPGLHIAQTAATSGPTRNQCHSGFKLFPGQSIPPQAAARLATTCIIYRRQNVTAQYLSLKRALRNGCWGTRPEEQRSCSPRGPDARLGNDFAGFRRAYWTWYRDVEQACAGRKTLHWTTEGYLTQVRSVLELAGLV